MSALHHLTVPVLIAALTLPAFADEPADHLPTAEPAGAPRLTEPLLLDKGTLQLGGSLSFGYERDLARDETGFFYHLTPHFGVFLVDNLELKLNLSHHGYFSEDDAMADNFGFGVGLRYVFETGTVIYPHVGASVGVSFYGVDPGSSGVAMSLAAPLGLLIGINRHVALDIGMAFTYQQNVGGPYAEDKGAILVPFGYYGLEAFF